MLRIRDFLILVRDRAEAKLPPELGRFAGRLAFSTLQLYRDDRRIHYEVWPQRKTGRIEIGLHFEGERDDNYQWAGLLSERMAEIQSQLGPAVELEEWTRSWTRLHQTMPFTDLDGSLAEQVAEKLARLIEVMEPVLEQESVAMTSRRREPTA